jgi:Tfp pilus assembly protein PilE
MIRRQASRRTGLTLIELIVVLVILVGLAGLIVPLLPNMITRTHTASGATNIQEINKWVQTYEALQTSYPDGWDGLTDGSDIVDYLPGSVSLTAGKLSAAEASALASAGITTAYKMVKSNPTKPTFDPYDGVKVLALSNTDSVAFVTDADAKLKLNGGVAATNAKFVVFGFGKRSTIVGKNVSEAPVHFADAANEGPGDLYGRFGVVFKVTQNDGVTPLNRAVFVGAVAFHEDGIVTAGDHIEEYYNTVKSSQ